MAIWLIQSLHAAITSSYIDTASTYYRGGMSPAHACSDVYLKCKTATAMHLAITPCIHVGPHVLMGTVISTSIAPHDPLVLIIAVVLLGCIKNTMETLIHL